MRQVLLKIYCLIQDQILLGRVLFLTIIYSLIFTVSLWLAFLLRFEFVISPQYQRELFSELPVILLLKLVMLYVFGQYGVLLSYFRLPDLYRIVAALSICSLVLIKAWYFLPEFAVSSRSVILADYVLSLFMVVGFRTSLRVLRERGRPDGRGLSTQKRVAIVGAGVTGANLGHDLMTRSGMGLRPVVYLDDDRRKWNHQLHGIPIVGSPDNLETVRDRFRISGIILAVPSAPAKRISELTELATSLGLSTDIMPSVQEWATGKVRASRIRPVEIEDLLGREPVDLAADEIKQMIKGKVVLVTGAGGSIGSELSRQIFHNFPSKLLLVDQSEVQLYQIDLELRRSLQANGNLVSLIADITDEARLRQIFERYRPQIIFHAAAHKHVPLMEYQPGEAIKNNTLGTRQVALLAKEYGVERFTLISTDKAINPTNVMGVSKRLAEIFIQSLNDANGGRTRFMAVRFGNVLGSSGSVVPLFRRQIADGGPVTVTHPEVIRYFMTIPEASGLVLQCASQGEGGEIFVLDMGNPIKIVDLAKRMIQLSGYEPGQDIEISFVGLRPGEKLFEELQHTGESHSPTRHPRILRFTGQPYPLAEVEKFLMELREEAQTKDMDSIKRKIQSFVPEYTPYFG